jgi:hypothetical protein
MLISKWRDRCIRGQVRSHGFCFSLALLRRCQPLLERGLPAKAVQALEMHRLYRPLRGQAHSYRFCVWR